MALDLDFTNVPRSNKLEEGDYIFVISDAEIEPNKAKDGQNLKVTFEVDQPAEHNGRTFTQWFALKEKSLWSLRLFLEALLGEEIEGSFQMNESAFPGNKIGATIEVDGDYNKVTAWFSV